MDKEEDAMKSKGFWRKWFHEQKNTETGNRNPNQKWMNSEKCKNGHWYDNSVHDACPYCAQDGGMEEKTVAQEEQRSGAWKTDDNYKRFPGMSSTTVCLKDDECKPFPEDNEDLNGYLYPPQTTGKEREEDFLQRLELSSKKCPNCGSPLYVFPHFCVFGDDDGYLCLKCHFKGYYGGTRYEGQSLWQVVNEGIDLRCEASD